MSWWNCRRDAKQRREVKTFRATAARTRESSTAIGVMETEAMAKEGITISELSRDVVVKN
jgi:hypothetical protein